MESFCGIDGSMVRQDNYCQAMLSFGAGMHAFQCRHTLYQLSREPRTDAQRRARWAQTPAVKWAWLADAATGGSVTAGAFKEQLLWDLPPAFLEGGWASSACGAPVC